MDNPYGPAPTMATSMAVVMSDSDQLNRTSVRRVKCMATVPTDLASDTIQPMARLFWIVVSAAIPQKLSKRRYLSHCGADHRSGNPRSRGRHRHLPGMVSERLRSRSLWRAHQWLTPWASCLDGPNQIAKIDSGYAIS